MSNKKRIQKKLSKINLNFEIKKFQIAMKILDDLIEKQNQKNKTKKPPNKGGFSICKRL